MRYFWKITNCLFFILTTLQGYSSDFCIPANVSCINNTCFISSFTIKETSLHDSTFCSNSNYNSYSLFNDTANYTATLSKGKSYSIIVYCSASSSVSLWADFNNDTIFTQNEWIGFNYEYNGLSDFKYTSSISIPLSAHTGKIRLRLRSRNGGYSFFSQQMVGPSNLSTDACTPFASGETEDYTVTIFDPGPCTAPPTAGTTIASNDTIAVNTPVSLSLVGNSAGIGLAYQWQKSADGVNWTNIPWAIYDTCSVIHSASSYYRCALRCNGLTSFSVPVFVTIKYSLQSYCISQLSSYNTSIGRVSFAGNSFGNDFPEYNHPLLNSFVGNNSFVNSNPINLETGTAYPIGVSQIFSNATFSAAMVGVYFDFNRDGDFNSPGEYFYLGTTFSVSNGKYVMDTIIIPPNAANGITVMRVVLAEGVASLSPCNTTGGGETEDYLINIISPQSCLGILPGGKAVAYNTNACGNKIVNISLDSGICGNSISYYWQYSFNDTNWTTLSASNSYLLSTSLTGPTYFRCATTCGVQTSFSSSVYIFQKAFPCYCESGFTNSWWGSLNISNVKLGTLNNGNPLPLLNNPSASNSYSNYCYLPPTVIQRGVDYPLTITLSTSENYFSRYSPNYVYVYIDLNHNTTFNTNEFFAIQRDSSFKDGSVYRSFIKIPASAANVLNGITRMRIMVSKNNYLQPCNFYKTNEGETEDYLINIIPVSPCPAAPFAGITVSNQSSVCSFDTINLSLNGNQLCGAITYQWQYSSNNSNWTNMVGYTAPECTLKQNQSTYYRCLLSCDTVTSSSVPLYISQKTALQCYCPAPEPYYPPNENIGNVTFASLNNGNAQVFNNSTNTYYSNFTSLSPVTLEKTGTYAMSVSETHAGNNLIPVNVIVFFDFNHDGVFSSFESYNLGYTVNYPLQNTVTSNIYIPNSALIGLTRMRVRMSENFSQDPCGDFEDGEVEDYTVNIVPTLLCSSAPNAGITTTSDTLVCEGSLIKLGLNGNSSNGTLQYQWQSSIDSISWNNITNATGPIYSLYHYQASYYRCKESCNGFVSYSVPVLVNIIPLNQCYCVSTPRYSHNCNIGSVSIASLNHGSSLPVFYNPTANSTYSNYINLPPTDLARSASYSVEISEIVWANYFYTTYVNLFIDFNQNSVFETGEGFAVGNFNASSGGNNIIQGSVMIPNTALLGNTRMRIVMASYPSVSYPCGPYDEGETEDYTVNIVPPINCPLVFSAGIANSSDTLLCKGNKTILSLDSFTVNPSQTFQWEYSYDNLNWNILTGANWKTYATTVQQKTYYRCAVTCGLNTEYSSTTYSQLTVLSECYCGSGPSALGFDAFDIGSFQIAGFSHGNANPAIANTLAINGFSDFTAEPPIELEIGANYYTAVSQISENAYIYGSNAWVFIDFNQDNVFDSITEAFHIGQTTEFGSITEVHNYITIPLSAHLGLTRMRVIMAVDMFSLGDIYPCSVYEAGETEDYLVKIIPILACTASISAGTIVSSLNTACVGDTINLRLLNNTVLGSQLYQWQSSADNINWQNISAAINQDYNFIFTSNAYYRCIVSCGAFTSITPSEFVKVNQSFDCYCNSTSFSGDDLDIGSIELNGLTSGYSGPVSFNPNAVNTYSNFGWLPPIVLVSGLSYPITVSQINKNAFFPAYVFAYIDFDQNGVFDAVTEKFKLGTTNASGGGNTIIANLIIPSSALSGITGMRLIISYDSLTPACGFYGYGETEDYHLNIMQTPPCSSLPNPGAANSETNSVCSASSFSKLYLVGNSYTPGQFYQWQFSQNGVNWLNYKSPSLDSSISFSQVYPTWYRCLVNCGGQVAHSDSVFVDILQSVVCHYCTNIGGTVCPSNTKITNVNILGTTLNNSDTICNSINGSSLSRFPFGGNSTAVLHVGRTYKIGVTATQDVSKSAWIDLNQNGSFEANEWIHICNTSNSGIEDTTSFIIPWGSTIGPTGLRVRTRINGAVNGSQDACSFFGSGETEDYIVLVDLLNEVKNEQVNRELSVFPNPTSSSVTIHLPNNVPSKIQLVNTIGEICFLSIGNSIKTEIDVSNISPGIYLLIVNDGKMEWHRKLSIVQPN